MCDGKTKAQRFAYNAEDHLDEGDLGRFFPERGQTAYSRFRPHAGIRYALSQTEARIDGGIVHLHLTETRVQYEPGQDLTPPDTKPPPVKWDNGRRRRCPVFEFDEEIQQRKHQLKLHKLAKEARRYSRLVAASAKKKQGGLHESLIGKVGPSWYQELSNIQYAVVDELKRVLNRDHRLKTIINTQEALSCLGIVLRANHTKVEYAIKKFHKCPVEFLLTLYKLLEPQRKGYSLNDKIILSAVVHLTMRDTLKQLHLRIPSPKRSKMRTQRSGARLSEDGQPATSKRRSPYQIPLVLKKTFRPEYEYKNRHKEYPYSRYFNYKSEMYEEIEDTKMPHQIASVHGLGHISRFARPPKIPVRLITRIAPKKRMIRRLVPPSKYTNVCDASAPGFLDGATGGPEETIHLTTEIDLAQLCRCRGFNGEREFTLEIDISTHSERIRLAQDIRPVDNTTGELRVVSIDKKTPSQQMILDEEAVPVKVRAHIEQKEPCQPCNPFLQCVCDETSGESSSTSDSREPCKCSLHSELLVCPEGEGEGEGENECDTTTATGTTTTTTAAAAETSTGTGTCDCDVVTVMAPPAAECAGAVSRRDECVCGGSFIISHSIIYSDTNSCVCRLETEAERADRLEKAARKACKCGSPELLDPICECLQPKKEEKPCRCLDYDEACKCIAKLDLTKRCECRIPNVAVLKNMPRKLCECKNPKIEDIDAGFTCDCLGIAFPPPPAPKRRRKRGKKPKDCLGHEQTGRSSCACSERVADDRVKKRRRRKKKSGRDCGCIPKRDKPARVRKENVCDCTRNREESEEQTTCRSPCSQSTGRDAGRDTTVKLCRLDGSVESSVIHAKPTRNRRTIEVEAGTEEPTCSCRDLSESESESEEAAPGPRYFSSKYEAGWNARETDERQKRRLERFAAAMCTGSHVTDDETEAETPPVQEATVAGSKASEEKTVKRGIKFVSEQKVYSFDEERVSMVEKEMALAAAAVAAAEETDAAGTCRCKAVLHEFEREHAACRQMFDDYQRQMYQKILDYVQQTRKPECKCADPVKQEKTTAGGAPCAAPCRKPKDEECDKVVCKSQTEGTKSPERSESEAICDDGRQSCDEIAMPSEESEELCVPPPPPPPQPKLKAHCECRDVLEAYDGCICLLPDPSDEPPWDYATCQCIHNLPPCTCRRGGRRRHRKRGLKAGDAKSLRSLKSSKSLRSYKSSKSLLTAEQSVEVKEDPRIITIEQFPSRFKDQMALLKRALEGLAEDGYPLAKLPDSHLLPQFRLWLRMRAGNYISMEQREHLNAVSKKYWNHILMCHRKVNLPDLGLSKQEVNKMTWKNYKLYHRMIRECKDDYYHRLKQAWIDEAREYFPVTFHHDLNTKTFRDCFFAYMPSDENRLHVIGPWQPHEGKDMSRRVSCL